MSIALRRASEASQLQSTLCDSVTQKLRVWAPQAKAGKSRKIHFPKSPHPHKHWAKSHSAFKKWVNSSLESASARPLPASLAAFRRFDKRYARTRTRRRGESPVGDCKWRDASSPEGLGISLRRPFSSILFARPSREPPRPLQRFAFSPRPRTRTPPSRHTKNSWPPFDFSFASSRSERS